MKYKAVLFDFDGTLLPSLPLWVKAYQYALRKCEVTLPDADVIKRCFFRDWEVVAADVGVASVEDLKMHMDVGLRSAFAEACLFPIFPDLLDRCRSAGAQVALVTSSPRTLLADVLPRLAIADHFDFVITGDDVAHYKPHPEPVNKTLAALGREPQEAIMIGDSRVDVLAGKAAGTATALFMQTNDIFHSEDVLRATNPDHIFYDHDELPSLLGMNGD